MAAYSEGFVDAKGRRIYYAKWGAKGPNLLLIHSMGMDAHSMDALCEALQGEYRILALTILGHGDSEVPSSVSMLPEHAEVMREAARKLGFTQYTLIGHSIGGMMGMILAAEHPSEVEKLVLVDIAPFEASRTGRAARTPPPERFSGEAEALTYLKERYPGFTGYYLENRLRYSFRKEEGALKLKPMGDSIREGMNVDLWPYVERIKSPTLLLAGETGIVTRDAEVRMRKLVPGLQFVKVMGTGHMIPQDKPEEFEKLIRAFLMN